MEEGFFKFSNLSKFREIIHGVSQRSYGDMRFGRLPQRNIIQNRQGFFQDLNIGIDEVVVAGLKHGAKITMVGGQERGKGTIDPQTVIPGRDGLMTRDRNVYLMITIADCLPIFIYDSPLQIVSILHAGWRGIVGGIVSHSIEKFKNCGSESENLVIGIGPGICQRHFVVKNDVLAKFQEHYPKATFIRNHDGYVDLKKAVEIDFIKAGVTKTNLEISTDCPSCRNGIYGSFRKEGKFAPASAAVIGMKA